MSTVQLWKGVEEYTKLALERGCGPLAWAVRLSSAMVTAGASSPSPELACFLSSHIFWYNDVPLAWKYLERALDSGLAPAPLLLALLSRRVMPRRSSRPKAYRLFLELLKKHFFSFSSQIELLSEKTMTLIDDALQLSQVFGTSIFEPGVIVVRFVFCIAWQLLDAIVEDEGLRERILAKDSLWASGADHDLEIDGEDKYSKKGKDSAEKLKSINTSLALDLLRLLLEHEVTSRLLYLVREHMSFQWESFMVRLLCLEENSLVLQTSTISSGYLMQLALRNLNNLGGDVKCSQRRPFTTKILSGYMMSSFDRCQRVSHSSLWTPLDLYLEDCMDTSVSATNSVEILSGLIKSLKAINCSTWHDAFLGLWMASLRLVQRERDPIEGPVPRLDARLCVLLSVTILAIANIIQEEEISLVNETNHTSRVKDSFSNGKCRKDLVSSLQALGDYESLLVPPLSVVSAANQAAAKAVIFLSGLSVGNGYLDIESMHENTTNLSGNMRHLIVEACISRNLLDVSAYSWPGYSVHVSHIPRSPTNQVLGWSALMNGMPLTPQMVNVLVAIPASSLEELERVYDIAVNGSKDDKMSASTIICGASLIYGWNIQEHVVCAVVKLLTPLPSVDNSGNENHLIDHGCMLNFILTGISSVDCVQIFSYHGLVPELAGALMAICEVFGSCVPGISCTLKNGEEITPHLVFSNAFILLMRLWKFNHTPLECCLMGDAAPVGSQLNPEYLLLLRNSRTPYPNDVKRKHKEPTIQEPIFLDSFPKLKLWYRQHQACLASTLSGLIHGTPVHQNVETLLGMMFRKICKGGNVPVSFGTSASGSLGCSSGPGSEDCSNIRPLLTAWDIMEAAPFVVDAALMACSYGRLSPRDLATGLKDLADFLPASLATIVSYFSAEVTRGVWKPAFMNGTDWPSPAANLSMVEEQIKKIVGATGVDVPSLRVGATSPATLPFPLAAFVSLTITYKLDKASERFLNLAGPTLENLAASCPWPSMPIVAALWTQKVKRWSDFLIFSASRTVFHHNNNAVIQLLRSCFAAAIGFSSGEFGGGADGLLGHGFGSHFSGGLSPVAPGILYLRVYRSIKDILILAGEILSLLMSSVKAVAAAEGRTLTMNLKNTNLDAQYGRISFAEAMRKVALAASVGATLLWLSGGSGLVQSLLQQILPSWFLSKAHELEFDGRPVGGMVYVLGGYGLARLSALCMMFAWGIDPTPTSKRRPRVVASHMEFLAAALCGEISLGCDPALWRSYVSGFLGIVVGCAASWAGEVDPGLLKKVCKGLRQWKEDELAISLLEKGGVQAMGAAAEEIILKSEYWDC